MTFEHIFLLQKVKNLHSDHSLFASNSIFYNFSSKFLMLSELHSLNLKLCSKQQYNKKFVLHLIVVTQLSGEQSMYSVMSMLVPLSVIQCKIDLLPLAV